MPVFLRHRGTSSKRIVSGPFNPLTQVTPLHAVWLSDALWTPPSDGSPIDSLRNQSGGGDPAGTTTERPTYRASVSVLNNRPAAEFNGTTNVLDVDISDVAQVFKVIVVGGFIATASSKGLVGFGASIGSGIGLTSGQVFYANVDGSGINSAVSGDTTMSVWRVTLNSTSSELWRDESSIATGIAGTGVMSWFRLGAAGTAGTAARFSNCYLAFVGIYAGATSDTSLSTLCNDLQTYYGTP